MRLTRIFFDVHMGLAHAGLSRVAEEHKVNLEKLAPGECVIFINRRKNRVKVYGANHTFAYHRSNRMIDLEVLRHIPESFNGSTINFTQALKKRLLEKFARR